MSEEEQRIAIAEACGWTCVKKTKLWLRSFVSVIQWIGISPTTKKECELPNYLNDLNAMHEAIGTLLFSQRRAYRINLKEIMSKKINPAVICYSECIDAPAAQRAEAFLKTLGLWKP